MIKDRFVLPRKLKGTRASGGPFSTHQSHLLAHRMNALFSDFRKNKRRLKTGTCFVTRHEPSGRYLLFGESGLLTIATMTVEGFQSHGQMKVLEPTQTGSGRKVVWTHPAYANQTAYVRNDKELVAVDFSSD